MKNILILCSILQLIFIPVCFGNTEHTLKKTLDISQLQFQIEEFVQNTFANHTEGDIKLSIKPLDNRLKLAHCEEDLQFSLPTHNHFAQRVTVNVRCNASPKPWQIYVPVIIESYKPVLIATKLLSPNEYITPQDISLQPVNILTLDRSYFDNPKLLVGKVVKQTIRAGSVIHPNQVSNAKLIKKGQLVNILSKNPNFVIRMQGRSLQDGSLNQRIQVENLSSKRIIDAYALNANEVIIHE